MLDERHADEPRARGERNSKLQLRSGRASAGCGRPAAGGCIAKPVAPGGSEAGAGMAGRAAGGSAALATRRSAAGPRPAALAVAAPNCQIGQGVALARLALFDHLLGDESLEASVRRLPAGALVVADNTFMSPFFQRPLALPGCIVASPLAA